MVTKFIDIPLCECKWRAITACYHRYFERNEDYFFMLLDDRFKEGEPMPVDGFPPVDKMVGYLCGECKGRI
jgi:hypothetical protein